AMGGYLGYESELGKGSTFWFDLPIAMETSLTGPDGELDTVQSRSTASGAERNPDTREKHTVLYIEDNPANLLLMEDVAIGFDSIDLISAASAETGLVMAKEVRPTLILMDINLPGMDGFTALKELQKSSETEDIPVIAVSANAMPDDLQRAKDAGFKGYVKKPFQIDALIGEIDSHLPK
ncbi:MAG TPA: response regulator, partial [Gammaproteobacteria bacterium]|nr:response regulator [Gammaproteobacteria bacterium]